MFAMHIPNLYYIKIEGHQNNTLNLPLFLQDWIKVYTKLNITKTSDHARKSFYEKRLKNTKLQFSSPL